MAAHLGASPDLVAKVPTADLENLVPLRPDEDAYGVTYDQIDDFLEGREIDEAARARDTSNAFEHRTQTRPSGNSDAASLVGRVEPWSKVLPGSSFLALG